MTDNTEYVHVTILFFDGVVFNIPQLRLLPFCSQKEIHERVQLTNRQFTGGVILHEDGCVVAENFLKAGSYIFILSKLDTMEYRLRFKKRLTRQLANEQRFQLANESYFGTKQSIVRFPLEGPFENGKMIALQSCMDKIKEETVLSRLEEVSNPTTEI